MCMCVCVRACVCGYVFVRMCMYLFVYIRVCTPRFGYGFAMYVGRKLAVLYVYQEFYLLLVNS